MPAGVEETQGAEGHHSQHPDIPQHYHRGHPHAHVTTHTACQKGRPLLPSHGLCCEENPPRAPRCLAICACQSRIGGQGCFSGRTKVKAQKATLEQTSRLGGAESHSGQARGLLLAPLFQRSHGSRSRASPHAGAPRPAHTCAHTHARPPICTDRGVQRFSSLDSSGTSGFYTKVNC